MSPRHGKIARRGVASFTKHSLTEIVFPAFDAVVGARIAEPDLAFSFVIMDYELSRPAGKSLQSMNSPIDILSYYHVDYNENNYVERSKVLLIGNFVKLTENIDDNKLYKFYKLYRIYRIS